MTREERLKILGVETVAAIHRRVAAAPPPSPELIAELHPILAPAMERVLAEEAEEARRDNARGSRCR
ncbi:hypothetical protein [Kitasatospora griseola]|uniref:hypothetical protein n=1 Tax=Kitasatospora griseola TaxID=2064 RepID=UPI0009FB931B|nr:hypothetical protein [Kitasatospora griseola]